MNVQRFLKHLKRKLRWKRNWIALGAVIAVCLTTWMLHPTGNRLGTMNLDRASRATFANLTPEDDKRFQESIAALKGITDNRETYLLKSYLCGEERLRLGLQTPNQLIEAQMKHPEWVLALTANGEITFTEKIEDLSPECKQKAVFGIDENGNLSLFNGTPNKDNVLRTFFQLNIRYLESSLPVETVRQLHEGIPVSDLEEYYSVLSTFSDYAVEETERVMTRP